ncbi:Uu.00g073410.m01.CDS01 [Anthostomella pinea]|uniref:Uu.00g073410.m01.CDS01 n=1 Tax=Anthostomella pinea TaxID=933095 RepID=A0AAI8VVA7_9PEZI|nr:Uu.00g073410.m01.CDS01 [Anthostomella pinea]
MSPPTILIIGATGKQGSAVLDELSTAISASASSNSSPAPKILALTRSASSPAAQALTSSYPGLDLELVEGNTKDPAPIFAAHPDISAVFSYTTPPDEEAQALALIDFCANSACSSSKGSKVRHFVFSSVDRGGDVASWDTPTQIPHFRSKHVTEQHLRAACEASSPRNKMTYTILRPVAFMDNLNPTSAFGIVFASIWGTMPWDTKLQLVSVRDIGRFAARALLHPEKYAGRAVGIAGDELTLGEARAVYRKVAGTQLPQAWGVVGWGVRWAVAEVGKMFEWFETDGYGVDVAKCREEEPRLQSLERWLREDSRFECGKGTGTGTEK